MTLLTIKGWHRHICCLVMGVFQASPWEQLELMTRVTCCIIQTLEILLGKTLPNILLSTISSSQVDGDIFCLYFKHPRHFCHFQKCAPRIKPEVDSSGCLNKHSGIFSVPLCLLYAKLTYAWLIVVST